MNTTSDRPNKVHEGRNVKRFREMMGIKQETIAAELGGDWSQKKVSLLESQDTIEDGILKHVAEILKVSPEAIRNFDEQSAITYINTFNDQSGSGAVFSGTNLHCTFNPIDKLVELYERLLASEREKIELLKNR